MEKYRKFDDPRVGVNPFIKLKEEVHSPLMMTGRFVSYSWPVLKVHIGNQTPTEHNQNSFCAFHSVQHLVHEPRQIYRKCKPD